MSLSSDLSEQMTMSRHHVSCYIGGITLQVVSFFVYFLLHKICQSTLCHLGDFIFLFIDILVVLFFFNIFFALLFVHILLGKCSRKIFVRFYWLIFFNLL
ncbi:hypothetical protein AAZV13_08G226700 [Glycine max]